MEDKESKECKDIGGRPTDYNPEYDRMAEVIIRIGGFSIPKMSKVFNVSRATIYNWMNEHSTFLDGITRGRKFYEGLEIEKSLVQRAKGFQFTETTKELKDGEMITTKKVKKFIPPDVAAIKHWQVNLYPEKWKDKQDLGVSGDLIVKIIKFSEQEQE